MATISLGSHGTKKALDAAIPLVPFIDLLLCCVMFLLVTAVWNDLSAIQVSQGVPGGATLDVATPPEDVVLLRILRDGYEVASSAGDREVIEGARSGELARSLLAFARLHGRADVRVSVDDGVPYSEAIRALDVAKQAGFTRIDLGDGGH